MKTKLCDSSKNFWPKLLEDYLTFVGDPNENTVKNLFVLFISIIYLASGIICFKYPQNIILNYLAPDTVSRTLFILFLILGGWYMLIYWLFLILEKKLVDKDNRKMHCIMWVLFFFIFVFELYKKIARFILVASRQQKTIQHLSDFFLSFLLTFLLFIKLYISIGRFITYFVKQKYSLEISDEPIALALVVSVILTFFLISKVMVCVTEKIYIYLEDRINVRSVSKNHYFSVLSNSDHINGRKNEYNKRIAQINNELAYSRVYFYLIVNFILLCIHVDPTGYGNLFKNTFFGVTTLAALVREVESKNSCNGHIVCPEKCPLCNAKRSV